MELENSVFAALPEMLKGGEWPSEKPDSVGASNMSILSFLSSVIEAMAFEVLLLQTDS